MENRVWATVTIATAELRAAVLHLNSLINEPAAIGQFDTAVPIEAAKYHALQAIDLLTKAELKEG